MQDCSHLAPQDDVAMSVREKHLLARTGMSGSLPTSSTSELSTAASQISGSPA